MLGFSDSRRPLCCIFSRNDETMPPEMNGAGDNERGETKTYLGKKTIPGLKKISSKLNFENSDLVVCLCAGEYIVIFLKFMK